MDESYYGLLAEGVEKRLRELEMAVMEDIIRRIQKTGSITSTADWQMQRLSVIGTSTEDIRKLVEKAVGGSEELVKDLYAEVIAKEYTSMKELYTATGKEFIPYEQNAELQQIVNAMIRQSSEDLVNITKSTGFMLELNGQKVWTPLAQVYNDYLDTAVMGMIDGTTDYNTATRKLVNQMTNSGLRSDHKFSDTGSYGGVDYASGWHNRVDVAARRALLTGFGQVAGKVTDMNAQRLGTNFFEVSWHGGARPDHATWQGRVFSKEQLRSVCGLGEGGGLLGWNCRHSYYPFIPGISERQYSDEWLAEKAAEEAQTKYYRGKEYNTYEATQKQRQIETNLRAYREKVQLMRQGGVDSETIMLTRCKYQALLDEYHEFSRKFNLPEQLERVYTGRTAGRIAPSRQSYAQWQAEQINKAKERAEEKRRKDMETHKKGLQKQNSGDIMELHRKATGKHTDKKVISEKAFNDLTIEARKHGANIILGTDEIEAHLAKNNASASILGDTIMFGKDVTISDVLEETYHFEQNRVGLNDDKDAVLRTILNEIDAKQYLIENAKKYKIPRAETEQTIKQLESYKAELARREGR